MGGRPVDSRRSVGSRETYRRDSVTAPGRKMRSTFDLGKTYPLTISRWPTSITRGHKTISLSVLRFKVQTFTVLLRLSNFFFYWFSSSPFLLVFKTRIGSFNIFVQLFLRHFNIRKRPNVRWKFIFEQNSSKFCRWDFLIFGFCNFLLFEFGFVLIEWKLSFC